MRRIPSLVEAVSPVFCLTGSKERVGKVATLQRGWHRGASDQIVLMMARQGGWTTIRQWPKDTKI
jgi:hypothetical protein